MFKGLSLKKDFFPLFIHFIVNSFREYEYPDRSCFLLLSVLVLALLLLVKK